ncbi:MAG: DUF2059 domain-containing protein [Verrucomicrobiota bacterium]
MLLFACLFGRGWVNAAPGEEPDPETIAAVEKFMRVMKVKEGLDPTIKSMEKMRDSLIDQEEISDEEKREAKREAEKLSGDIVKMMTWDHIGPSLVRVYAKVFTTQEVNGLIELFESPAGQVYVEKQEELRWATMEEMQKVVLELMPKLKKKVKEAVGKVEKESAEKK